LQNDFVSDEYMAKNARVRPTSSGDRREESEVAKRQFSDIGGDDQDDDRKFNEDMMLEINISRHKQKDRKRKDEELKLLEAEKAEKKKKAK
jgi:hypothetical protein